MIPEHIAKVVVKDVGKLHDTPEVLSTTFHITNALSAAIRAGITTNEDVLQCPCLFSLMLLVQECGEMMYQKLPPALQKHLPTPPTLESMLDQLTPLLSKSEKPVELSAKAGPWTKKLNGAPHYRVASLPVPSLN